MRFWFEFFRDKRFSLSFKIANFIMRDRLREYIAVNCAALREVSEAKHFTEFHKRKVGKVIRDLHMLMGK